MSPKCFGVCDVTCYVTLTMSSLSFHFRASPIRRDKKIDSNILEEHDALLIPMKTKDWRGAPLGSKKVLAQGKLKTESFIFKNTIYHFWTLAEHDVILVLLLN
jgi:hypothetical protein